jgi:stearoyl-CoA desaturase (delta-9 desaturase)
MIQKIFLKNGANVMALTHNLKVRGLQIINHILLLIGLGYVFMTGSYELLGISLIMYVITGMLGVNIGLHRLLSHRSFKTYPVIEKLLSLVSVVTTIGSPLAWVAVHRQHHRACETINDPHSPYVEGKFSLVKAFKVWFGLWEIINISPRIVRDLRQSEFQRWIHKNYLELIIGYNVILALINPLLIIFAYAIPACLCLHSTSSIIVIAHKHGYRNHDLGRDQSRNSWIAHLMSLGEGWHNNHHAKAWAWNQSEKWWEFDPPSWVIRLIRIKD